MKLQRYYLEIIEYSPTIKHIEGKVNNTADILSRMDFDDSSLEVYEIDDFPLSTRLIYEKQHEDKDLRKIIDNIEDHKDYQTRKIEGNNILCKKDNNRMIAPKSMRADILKWHHEVFGHPGIQRMNKTIKNYFEWSNMINDVTEFIKTCHICQTSKINRKKYGKLEPTTIDVDIAKFEILAMDLVGKLPNRLIMD